MADVASSIESWSTTASSNAPAGATSIGTGLDDNLREIQAVVRAAFASLGSNIASASTTDLGAVAGLRHFITGTTTINSFGTLDSGIVKFVVFEGALTLTYNGTSMILPGARNLITAAGDQAIFQSEGSGNWRCIAYTRASGRPVLEAVLQRAYAEYTTSGAITDVIPVDDTIPTGSEGFLILQVVITPKFTTSRLRIRFQGYGTLGTSQVGAFTAALSQAGVTDALRTSLRSVEEGGNLKNITLEHEYSPATTSAVTLNLRIGPSAGTTLYLNGNQSGRLMGGSLACTMVVEEVTP